MDSCFFTGTTFSGSGMGFIHGFGLSVIFVGELLSSQVYAFRGVSSTFGVLLTISGVLARYFYYTGLLCCPYYVFTLGVLATFST